MFWPQQDIPPLIDAIVLEKRIAEVDNNLSGLTWDASRQSLLTVTNQPETVYQLDREENILAKVSLPELKNTESISVGWGDKILQSHLR